MAEGHIANLEVLRDVFIDAGWTVWNRIANRNAVDVTPFFMVKQDASAEAESLAVSLDHRGMIKIEAFWGIYAGHKGKEAVRAARRIVERAGIGEYLA